MLSKSFLDGIISYLTVCIWGLNRVNRWLWIGLLLELLLEQFDVVDRIFVHLAYFVYFARIKSSLF